MERKELAKQLRDRLLSRRLVKKEVLKRISDDDVIDSYIKCGGCHEYFFPIEELDMLVRVSKDAEDFLNKTGEYAKALHNHESKKTNDAEKDLVGKDLVGGNFTDFPHYVGCLTSYYDPKDKFNKKRSDKRIFRVAMCVTDLFEDKVIGSKDILSSKGCQIEEAIEELFEFANSKVKELGGENKDLEMIYIEEVKPAEKCSCGCGRYFNDSILRKNYLEINNQ